MNKALKIEITCSGTEVLPLAELIPFQGGLKTLLDKKRAKLRNSILKHGVSFPFFVWRHAGKVFVLDGHQRDAVLNDLEQEGYEVPSLPVVYIEAATEKEAREKILLLSSQYGEMTEDSLAEYLKAAGIELADILGTVDLPTIDLEAMAQRILQEQSQEAAPVPEPPANPVSVLGDLYELGSHRLMCGDATKGKDHNRLLSGSAVNAVVSDPPYGVGVNYDSFQDTAENVAALIPKIMPLILKWPIVAMTPGIPAMWFYPKPTWLLAWIHPAPVGGCPWGFGGLNPILIYGQDPYLASGLGRRPDHIVMATDRNGIEGHPTPKPQKVWNWLVERVTPKTDSIIFDPFLGSGTTLIACEQLGRRCYAMEISPAYVDVAIQRYLNLRPGAEVKRNGKSVNWANLCATRAKD